MEFDRKYKTSRLFLTRVTGALLAFFFLRGIELSHSPFTTTGADKSRSQLVGSERQDIKKQTGAPAVQARLLLKFPTNK